MSEALGVVENPKHPDYTVGIAKRLRKTQTEAEEILWSQLRSRRLGGAKFRRQHPIGRYIADFYCHSASLVVEIDGGIHNQADRAEYDGVRDDTLIQGGLKVLRLNNEQILIDIEGALDLIKSRL